MDQGFDMKSMMQKAQDLAQQGYPVFPVGNDKRPLIAGGFKAASNDSEVIRGMWQTRASANIGIPTGRVSGFVVVDVDVKNGHCGFESLGVLERDYGPFDTRKVTTPSGGQHLIFCTDQAVKTKVGILDGIDIRGDGGYILAHGSSIDGVVYEVAYDVEPVEMPAGLIDFINGASASTASSVTPIQGARNDHVFRLGSSRLGLGESYEQALCACRHAGLNCKPPLDQIEILKIVDGIYGRYTPNSEKITKESVQANRNRWQREIRIEWAKCDMDMRFALVNSMPPSAYVAHEKVSLALWYRGRLSKADFDFTAGLTGAELESLEQHFDHCEGWYESVNVNDMYEDSYSRILIKRSNGSKGGRPKVNNL